MAMNLIKANVQKNASKIDEVIEDLTNIRWGFQKAIEIQSGLTTVDEAMKETTNSDAVQNIIKSPENIKGDENAG